MPVHVLFEREENDLVRILSGRGHAESFSESFRLFGLPLVIYNLRILASRFTVRGLTVPSEALAEIVRSSFPQIPVRADPGNHSGDLLKIPLDSIVTSRNSVPPERNLQFTPFNGSLQNDGFVKITHPWDILSAMTIALKDFENGAENGSGTVPESGEAGVSQNAIVSDKCVLGRGSRVGHFAILGEGVVSSGASFGNYVEVSGRVFVGRGALIGPHTVIENSGDAPIYIGSNVVIGSGARIRGPGIMDDASSLGDASKLSGTFYIGRNTTIGDNTRIRHSMIGANSAMGMNCEIARSYIAVDTITSHYNCLLDSVLGQNVWLGGYVGTTNMLWNGRPRMKIDGMLMDPHLRSLGAVIGAKARIGAGTITWPGRLVPAGVEIPINYSYESFEKFERESKTGQGSKKMEVPVVH